MIQQLELVICLQADATEITSRVIQYSNAFITTVHLIVLDAPVALSMGSCKKYFIHCGHMHACECLSALKCMPYDSIIQRNYDEPR